MYNHYPSDGARIGVEGKPLGLLRYKLDHAIPLTEQESYDLGRWIERILHDDEAPHEDDQWQQSN
jgi:hypothetical protein